MIRPLTRCRVFHAVLSAQTSKADQQFSDKPAISYPIVAAIVLQLGSPSCRDGQSHRGQRVGSLEPVGARFYIKFSSSWMTESTNAFVENLNQKELLLLCFLSFKKKSNINTHMIADSLKISLETAQKLK